MSTPPVSLSDKDFCASIISQVLSQAPRRWPTELRRHLSVRLMSFGTARKAIEIAYRLSSYPELLWSRTLSGNHSSKSEVLQNISLKSFANMVVVELLLIIFTGSLNILLLAWVICEKEYCLCQCILSFFFFVIFRNTQKSSDFKTLDLQHKIVYSVRHIPFNFRLQNQCLLFNIRKRTWFAKERWRKLKSVTEKRWEKRNKKKKSDNKTKKKKRRKMQKSWTNGLFFYFNCNMLALKYQKSHCGCFKWVILIYIQ